MGFAAGEVPTTPAKRRHPNDARNSIMGDYEFMQIKARRLMSNRGSYLRCLTNGERDDPELGKCLPCPSVGKANEAVIVASAVHSLSDLPLPFQMFSRLGGRKHDRFL